MTIHKRLKSLGVSDARLAAIGVAPSVKSKEVRDDGLNPVGVSKDATRRQARELAERAVTDISAWRAYRDANPWMRLQMRQENGSAIDRGRELDTDEGGPSAA